MAKSSKACAVLLEPRTLLEVAAEIDPDFYVPILDLLDEDSDLEDDECEPGCDEDESSVETLWVNEFCACCGSVTNRIPEGIA